MKNKLHVEKKHSNSKKTFKSFFSKFFVLDNGNFFSNLFSKEFILRIVVYLFLGMLAMVPVLSQRKMPSQEVLDKLPPGFVGPYIPIFIFTIIAVLIAVYLLVLCYINKPPKRFAWLNFLFVLFNLIFYIDFDFWGLRDFYVGSMLILLLAVMLANMLISSKYGNDKKLKYLIIGGFFFIFIGLVLRFGDLFDKTQELILFSKIIISFGIVIIYLFSIVSLFDNLILADNSKKYLLFTKILYALYLILIIIALPFLLKYFWKVPDNILYKIIIPIYASSVAGVLTLAGVGWTIKAQHQSIKDEKLKSAKPILLQKEGASQSFETYELKISDTDLEKHFIIEKSKKKYYIAPLSIKNTDNSLAKIHSIKINNNIIKLLEIIYVEKNEWCKLEFNFKRVNIVPEKIILIVSDIYDNDYEYEFRLKSMRNK